MISTAGPRAKDRLKHRRALFAPNMATNMQHDSAKSADSAQNSANLMSDEDVRTEFLTILRRAAGSDRAPYGGLENWLKKAATTLGRPFTFERVRSLYRNDGCIPSVVEMDAARAWAAKADAKAAANQRHRDNVAAIAAQAGEQAQTFPGAEEDAGVGPPTDILAEIHRCLAMIDDIAARLKAIEMALIGDNGDGHKK